MLDEIDSKTVHNNEIDSKTEYLGIAPLKG